MEQVLSMNNKPKPDEHEYRRPFTTREEPAHQAYDSLYQSNKQQQHPSGTLIYDHNRVVGEAVTQQQQQPHVVNEYEVSKVEEKVEETFNLIEDSHIVENEFDKVEPREPVHLINIINEATKINTNKINTSPTPSPTPIKLTTNKLTILTETPTTTSSKPSRETPPQFSFVDFIDFKSIPVYPYPNENDDDLLLKTQLEREQKDKLKQEQQQQKEKQEAYEREQREKAAELLIQQQQQQQERKDREQQQQKQREKEQHEQLLKQKLRLDQHEQPKPEEALLGKRKPFFFID
jgi:hypothetical protein